MHIEIFIYLIVFYRETLSADATTKENNIHPANFGHGCSRWCICEVPGQVPCSGFVTIHPDLMGKNTWQVLKQKEKEEM